MSYTKTQWNPGGPPGISAENLNKIESGIEAAHKLIETDTHTPNQSDTAQGSGTLLKLQNYWANMLRRILGTTNWYDAPPTTLTAAKSHIDAAAPHSGHETPAGALAKAEAAAGAVRAELNTHKAEIATETEYGHVRLQDIPKGKKVARFVIGTSASGWTQNDVDYLCDGTSDHVEINQAIQDLPADGGEIIILDGTYNIGARIDVNRNNVTIRGNGDATILKRMWNSSSVEGVITLNSVSNCKIENLQIDGNRSAYTSSDNHGIYLSSSSNNTITGNTCNNNRYGIYLYSSSSDNTVTGNICNNNNNYGIYLYSSSNNTVTGNTCNNNNGTGIGLYSSSSNNTVTGNTCNNNNGNGIYLYSSSNNTVTGNTCNNNSNGIYLFSSSNNNTVTGNTCNNNSNSIYLFSSSNNTVTGNTCNNNNYGIRLFSSSNNTVTGNTCIRGTGQPSDYTSSQYTIHLSGSSTSYNLISSNNCMGKDVVIDGGTGNTSVNNKYN